MSSDDSSHVAADAPQSLTLPDDYRKFVVKNQWYRVSSSTADPHTGIRPYYGRVRVMESWHGASAGTYWRIGFELGPDADIVVWERISGTKYDYRNQEECPENLEYDECSECDECMKFYNDEEWTFSDHCEDPEHAKWGWLGEDFTYMPMELVFGPSPKILFEECDPPLQEDEDDA